jgi:antitoxin component YwqK of YwqJK toxin-antitoxin module
MCSTNYKHNSEKFWAKTGEMIQYYKNGQIAHEYFLDNYGNMKRMKIFDRKGNKVEEYLTMEIDSNAKSLNDFFESQNHISDKTFCQIYRYSKDTNSYFLYEEGQRVNSKKSGNWVTYYNNGKVKKEKKF